MVGSIQWREHQVTAMLQEPERMLVLPHFLLCIQPGILANRAVLFTFRVGLSSFCKPFWTRPEVCFHVDSKLSLVGNQD